MEYLPLGVAAVSLALAPDALLAACEAAAQDPALRCVVLTGGGEVFCPQGSEEQRTAAVQAAKLLRGLTVPVIAAVEGDCLSVGMDLLLLADLAVCTGSAQFGYPDIRQGHFPVNQLCEAVDVLPRKRVLEAFYTGRLLAAQDVWEAGLVNQVVNAEELLPTAFRMAERIAAQPAELIALGRRAYFTMAELPLDARRAYGMKILPEVIEAERRYLEAHGMQ